MSRSCLRGLLSLVALSALVMSACATDEPTPADVVPEGAVTITAADYSFDVPSRIEASAVSFRFVNEGGFAHEAAFVKLVDQSPEDVFEQIDALFEDFSGPVPDVFYDGLQVVGELQPGEDAVSTEATMTAGTWLLFCALSDSETREVEVEGERAEVPHYQFDMFTVVEVTGDDELEIPRADGTVTIRDYTFEADLRAGRQTLVAVNEGPDQLHHVIGFDFGEDVDPAEAEEQFRAGLAQEPGEDEDEGPPEAFSSGLMSPGYGQTFEADIESGHTYLLVCFIHDREGGPPHAIAYDMLRAFAVD